MWLVPPFPSGFRPRIGVRAMLSYQSPMPAAAGTLRYQNWVHCLMEGSGVVCAPHPTPSWGQAPALHFSLPAGNEPQLEGVSGPAILEPMTRWHPVYAGMEGTICSRT